MRLASLVGIAAGLVLAAASPWPANAASYGLVLPSHDSYPSPYLSIVVDDPNSSSIGPPIDVGAGDFTIELFIKAAPGSNTREVDCGESAWWPLGNVLLDRSRGADEGGRAFGLSVSRTRIAFGVTGAGGVYGGVCGSRSVADGFWHHVAVQRRAADGRMTIWVDGTLDAAATGPAGDVSYPDNAVPPFGCANCTQDPWLFIGGKANQSAASFIGSIDELRVSDTIRYAATFARPARAFSSDARTVALYHFDDGAGSIARDTAGGQDASFGDDATGRPAWAAGSPFAALPGNGGPSPAPALDGRTTRGTGGGAEPSLGASASAEASVAASPGSGDGSAGRATRRPPATRSNALAIAAPIAGGVAALGFLVAMIVLGMRAAQRA